MKIILSPVGLGCDHLNVIEIDLNTPKVVTLGRNSTTTHTSTGEAQNIGNSFKYLQIHTN